MVQLVLHAPVSFRAASAIAGQLSGWAGFAGSGSAPAANTVQDWLLRLGLYELQRPKEIAEDWIWIVDLTIQLGSTKCLLIVAVRRSAWEVLDRPLQHEDLSLLRLEPLAHPDGQTIYEQLQATVAQTGVPCAILQDQGTELTKGAQKFQQEHPACLLRKDIAHAAALALKKHLQADDRWASFTTQCAQTQPRIQQTELAHLAAPKQKLKGRYMNLEPLIAWGQRLLRLLDTPAEERPSNQDFSRLEERLGWLLEYRDALSQWSNLLEIIQCTLHLIRSEGYHLDASAALRRKHAELIRSEAAQRLSESLLALVEEQSQDLPAGDHLPASSEVLESLIGKGKRLQGPQSRHGFTKMILAMGACVSRLSEDLIGRALQTIRHVDLEDWVRGHLGISLTAQRRQALQICGTKAG